MKTDHTSTVHRESALQPHYIAKIQNKELLGVLELVL
jgi:hypothetical protein